jgi:hypothetical protein
MALVYLLVVIAIVVVIGSWSSVTVATSGVAGLCTACFLLVLARVCQADLHHRALLAKLTTGPQSSEIAKPVPTPAVQQARPTLPPRESAKSS